VVHLDLGQTSITDAGLVPSGAERTDGTASGRHKITDAGLANLEELHALTYLNL